MKKYFNTKRSFMEYRRSKGYRRLNENSLYMINSDYVSDIIFNVCKQIFHSNKVYLKVYYDNEKFLAVELEDLEAKLEVATQYICDNLTPDVVTAISKFLGYDVEGYNGDEVYVELLFKTIKILKDNYDITVTEDERPMNY